MREARDRRPAVGVDRDLLNEQFLVDAGAPPGPRGFDLLERRYLLLVHELGDRLLRTQQEWLDEVERELRQSKP